MNKGLLLLFYSLGLVAYGQLAPPKAKKIPVVFTEFGHLRVDEYAWMNNKSDSAVTQHIQRENSYAQTRLQPLLPLQQTLFEEMKSRQPKTFSSLPVKRNGYWYYSQFPEGKAYPTYYRRKGSLLAKEETLADANALAAGQPVFYFEPPVVSPDNRQAVFLTNNTGDRRYTATVKDLVTGQMLADSVPSRVASPPVWTPDSQQFFYIEYNQAMSPYRVMRHRVGQSVAQDQELFQEKDSTFAVSMATSTDRQFLFISSTSPTTGEVLYLPLSSPEGRPTLLVKREPEVEVSIIDHVKNYFYLLTNYHAKDYQIDTVGEFS